MDLWKGEARVRPHGDPDRLAAAGRLLAAASAEMDRIAEGIGDLRSDLAGPAVWRGRASEAYRARDGLLQSGTEDVAGALRLAAGGLSELSTGLAGAQSLWDRASSLAVSAGLALDPAVPGGLLALPLPSADSPVATAARVAEMAREASEQASSADRSAARHLAEAATIAGRAAASGSPARPGEARGDDHRGSEGRAGQEGRGEHGGRSLLARGLEVADRIGIAVGAGLTAVESRASALTRLVRSGREPAASLAAVRALTAFERSAFTDTLAAFLPLGGPAITLAANLVGGEGDEPLLRALVRSLGSSLGADAGQRIGMAVCGVESVATEGAGVVLCPAVTIAATSAGATLGGAAAVRIYDALGSEPSPDPATAAPGIRDGPGR